MRTGPFGGGFVALVGLLCAAATATAQDAGPVECDDTGVQGPDLTFPVNGARQVTLDAPLRIRYSVDYFTLGPGRGVDPNFLLEVERCSGRCGTPDACSEGGEFVPGLVQRIGDELVFLPDGGWEPSAVYGGIARGRDQDRSLAFCTGEGLDSRAPDMGAIGAVTPTPVMPSCEAPDGGYRIGVFFDPAFDDGPPGSIEYVLFQTRGAGIDGPVVRDRTPNYATDQVTLAFNLPPDEAESPICVAVAAIDGVGNVGFSEPRDSEDCIDPVQGNFFSPLCSAHAANQGRDTGSPVGLAILTLLALIRRRRR